MNLSRVTWTVLLAGTLLLTACGARNDTQNAQQVTDDLIVTLIPAPQGYTGDHLTVVLTDPDGTPITDVSVSVEGNMNHAGMAPVLTESVLDEADGTVDGRYRVPFTFTMLGDWIVTVSVNQADGTRSQHDVDLTVTEEAVTIQ
ncbi:MAG: FixH family protein [Caldilineaceae bacterium]|nr:FixH family protein [Caldilineaceae bacterium]